MPSASQPTKGSGFCEAMSALASGVALVTSWVDDRPWGMTVTSFTSVSVEPATILVSLGSATASAHAIAETRVFGVSVLAEGQLAVARFGSEPGAARFLEWFVDPGERRSVSPVVAGALTHLDCRLDESVPVADHRLFVGSVRAALTLRTGAPLVYHRRTYRTLDGASVGRRPRQLSCL